MNTEQNRKLLENNFAGRGDGTMDAQALLEMLDENVEFTVIGTMPWSGTYRGREELGRKLMATAGQALKTLPTMTLKRLLVDGDNAMVEFQGAAEAKNGVTYNNTYCWSCDLRDGRIVRVTEYLDTALVVAAFSG